jgi:DNA-binding XRE family transcriptional regulator
MYGSFLAIELLDGAIDPALIVGRNFPQFPATPSRWMGHVPRAGTLQMTADGVGSRDVNRVTTEPSQKTIIGANIRHARRQAGLSQPQLAKALGTSRTRISEYEHGRITPHDDRIGRICEITGAPSRGWFYDPHDEVEL